MAKKNAAEQESEARLDNLTLARKEGWQRFVEHAGSYPARIFDAHRNGGAERGGIRGLQPSAP